jgi:hypothetical protein
LLRSARTVIDTLRLEASDPVILAAAVRDYVQRAVNAGISRARIREALELLAHEHGGRRWSGMATTIASLATGHAVDCSQPRSASRLEDARPMERSGSPC